MAVTIAAPGELVERACTATGLSDLGAGGWEEGLDRLIEAARHELVPAGDTAARVEGTVVRRLVNRLRIEAWYHEHRASAGAVAPVPPVEGPVVILGLPRTGTTALQHLLAVGREFRYQRRWEVADPVPPPDTDGEAHDPRRLAALGQADASGGFSVRHISAVDGPVDDGTVLGLDFRNQELGWRVPSYTRWWRSCRMTTTYAYHERVLRLLHSRRPPRLWLVKAPYHNFHLAELAARYPGARFVMTHRDPAVAFPSTCSTVADARRSALPSQPLDMAELGSFLLEHLVDGISRAMRARDLIGDDRFLDVTQDELEADAVSTADRVYRFVGLEMDASTRAAMREWAVANRRGARGEHRYHAEEYGVTPAGIRQAFAAYIARFDVPADDGPDRRKT